MTSFFSALLGITALVVLVGVLVYLNLQRENLNKQITEQRTEVETEREKLKGQAEARQKELLVEAREEALRLRAEV